MIKSYVKTFNTTLQNWICIEIKEDMLFYNYNEKIITYHPPFMIEDLDLFLVK